MDTHITNIRLNIRQFAFRERKEQRDAILNRQRRTSYFKDNPDLTAEFTADLARKIKDKGKSTLENYSLVNRALIQNEENITVFYNVDGAVHGVVRDLTGQNAALQLEAANCCCNLSLGNEKQCVLLARSAAPYLMSFLDGLNIPLMDVSAWTLGNLAGGGAKPWHILKLQGLLPKLLNHVNSSNVLLEPAVYALTHYVHSGITEGALGEESLLEVAQRADALIKAGWHGYWLLYLLSCSPACCHQMSLVDHLLKVLPMQEDTANIISMVRILGNLCAEPKGSSLLLQSVDALKALQFLLSASHHHVHKEVLWLIGNVINNAPVEQHKHLQHLCNELETDLRNVISKVNLLV